MTADYERLEFLGDSVLKLIISTQLYKKHPSWAEGHLTLGREAYECNSNLLKWTIEKGLDKYIRHRVGINNKDESGRSNIYSDVFESVFGAIFVDCNYDFNKVYIIFESWNLQLTLETGSSSSSNCKDTNGRTALDYARSLNKPAAVIDLLERSKAPVNYSDVSEVCDAMPNPYI